MRLRSWRIDGFGVFRDFQVDDLSPGLNVFYGANEAGKSTLLAFLRGVLFGFPRGNSSEPRYPPLRGGSPGGSVTLVDEAGEVVVERLAAGRRKLRVTLPGDVEGDASQLASLLGHADRPLYRNVFAFSLSELQSLSSLTQDGIQDRIFSAGISGAGRSAREALEALDSRAGALFRSGRGAHRAGELRTRLREVEGELAQRRELARSYPELRAGEEELSRELGTLRSESERARRGEATALKLGRLWHEVWNPLLADREALAKQEAGADVPADGVERLERSVARADAAEERVRLLDQERRELEMEHATLEPDDALESVSSEVEGLVDRLVLHRQRLERLPVLRYEAERATLEAAEALRKLGTERAWDEEGLQGFDRSISRSEELRGWRRRLERGERQLEETRQERSRLEQRLERARARELDLRRERGEVRPVPAAELQARSLALADLRTAVADRAAAEVRLHAERSRCERDESTQRDWRRPLWFSFGLVVGALALCAGLYHWLGDRLIAGVAAAGLAAVLLVDLLHHGRAARARERSLGRQRELVSQCEHALAELGEHWAPRSQRVGFERLPSTSELDGAERALARDREASTEWQRRDDRVRQARDALREIQAELSALLRLSRGCEEAKGEAERQWLAWKQEEGFPSALGPESAAEFLDQVAGARAAIAGRHGNCAALSRCEGEIRGWESQVRRLLASVGPAESEAGGETLIHQLTLLRECCDTDRAVRLRRAEIDQRSREIEAQREAPAHALSSARKLIASLLSQSGVGSVEEFRREARLADGRRSLEERVAGRSAELTRRLGSGEAAAELRASLETGQVAEWEAVALHSSGRAEELERQRDETLRRHHERRSELTALERSSDLGELELQRSALRAQLQTVLEEWRRLRLASGLIRATLERFERERQPAVLQEASHLFACVTEGRYKRIVQLAEANGVAVLDHADRRVSAAELSRGTAEQLYICIRLGLCAEFARRSVALPVVMDDVLVNFDDRRAGAMAEVVARFAAEHQLLYFTCSSQTRDLLRAADPNAEYRELAAGPRGG